MSIFVVTDVRRPPDALVEHVPFTVSNPSVLLALLSLLRLYSRSCSSSLDRAVAGGSASHASELCLDDDMVTPD